MQIQALRSAVAATSVARTRPSPDGDQVRGADQVTITRTHPARGLRRLAALSQDLIGSPYEPSASHATAVQETPEQAYRVVQPTPRELDRERRQYNHIGQALATGRTQSFRNGQGAQMQLNLSRNRDKDGLHSYNLQVGRGRLEVSIDPSLDQTVALGRIADFYSQQPERFRGAVKTMKVLAGSNPANGDWATRYDMPGFRSAATGGGGNITFYEGLSQLKESVANHEFGHNIGGAVRGIQDQEARRAGRLRASRRADNQSGDAASQNVPRGYSQAIRDDNNSVSSYGSHSVGEDFAEFYEAYREASEKGTQALDRFVRRYPARYVLFEREVMRRSL